MFESRRWRLRALPATVALGATVVLVAGCGGSGSTPATRSGSPSTGTTTPASAPPSPSATAMTKAQATAQARAINLTKADLPSFRAEPNPTTAADRAANAQMAKCAGGVPPGKAVVDSGSPSFTQGSGLQQIEADSSVTVMPSAALVQQDLAAFRSKKARQCVSTLIGGELERSSNGQVQITGLRMTPLSPPAHGTDGAFGYRFTMTAVAGSMRIPFYAELWGFAHGPLEVGLTTFGIGTPFPRDLATKLWGVLVTRAAGTPS